MKRFPLLDKISLKRFAPPSGSESGKKAFAWVLVLVSYLVTAQIGLYLYHNIGTSPALIWPPVGIALSAVILEGYWIGSAIAVGALMTATLMGFPLFLIVGSAFASTIQPLFGGYIMRKLRFDSHLNSLRDVFMLICVSIGATLISPVTNCVFVFIYDAVTHAGRPFPPWTEMWIGGALSALVLTPFLTRWIGHDFSYRTRLQQLEVMVSVTLVTVLSYVVFSTAIPPSVDTALMLLLLGSLFWIAFRVGPRAMSLAMLMLTAISLAGTIYGVHWPNSMQQSLSDRLLSTEIFDLILAFFFFILVSVEEQRKEAIRSLSLDAERLESALETIRAEDRAKNEFIATLAHELRNPLAPIMSGLELLRLDEKEPEKTEILESAQRQAFIMRRLLDELLDVARIARRSFVLKKEEASLQKILRQSIDSVKHFYKERELNFSSTIIESDLWLEADPVRLNQVFTNILYNAGKYTEPGGAITLVLEQQDRMAVIKVKDNGVGISKDMLARIFEPFVQDAKHGEVGTGLGIGLSIAKRLVELHGGTIKAESDGKGRGSIFTVEIPVHEKRAEKKQVMARASIEPSSILVVDDNADAAMSMARLLRTKGNTVDIAFSGKEAIQALEKKPQYVLLDIGLPDMEGHVVAKEIRSRNPETIVIALSGYGSRDDKRRAMEAGISVHLTKPASLKDIEAAMVANV